MSLVELQISEIVEFSTQSNDDSGDPIPLGKRATIKIFSASVPDSAKSYTKLEFGNEIIWGYQRSGRLDKKIEIKGDGIKKFNLICVNDCDSNYFYNAYVQILIED